MHVSFGILDFLYIKWTKSLILVEAQDDVIRTWSLYFVNSKYLHYMQYCMMLLEHCGHKMANVQTTLKWLDEDQSHVCLVTWLDFFCIYLKLLLASIFNSVDFRSSLSSLVLGIELADENVIKVSGVSIDKIVQEYSFRPPMKYKPTKKTVWCTRNLHRIECESGRLDCSELLYILSGDEKDDYFAEGTEKC